jgi:hypothetical protein
LTDPLQDWGVMSFEWELPALLENRFPSAGRRAKTEFVLDAITLVARGKFIELYSCRQYLDKFFPERGVRLVETIIKSRDTVGFVIGKSAT